MLREVDEIEAYRELLSSAQHMPHDEATQRQWIEAMEETYDIGLITAEMREILMEVVAEAKLGDWKISSLRLD